MSFKTVKEVAKEFNVNQITIKRMIYEGKVNAIKVGRQWRISEEELNKIKEQKNERN
jgi:putative resolvase